METAMSRAIEFAKEIIKTDNAIQNTHSEMAKRDLSKSRTSLENDLMFYCKCHNIKYADALFMARMR